MHLGAGRVGAVVLEVCSDSAASGLRAVIRELPVIKSPAIPAMPTANTISAHVSDDLPTASSMSFWQTP